MNKESESPPPKENGSTIVKFSLLVVFSIAITAVFVLNINDVIRSKAQFVHWYPQFGYTFSSISKNNCSREYNIYRYDNRQNTSLVTERINGAEYITAFTEPMMNCILNNTSEYIKSTIGSSQVMLGLTPTIIALIGASSEEVCLMALIGRRRVLALLLAAASPSIYTTRAFEYRNPGEIIKERLRHEHIDFTLKVANRKYFVLLEYLCALLAFLNVVMLSWELGVKSINGVSPNITLMPMLWVLLAIPAHLGGAVVFHLKARRKEDADQRLPGNTKSSRLQSWMRVYWDVLRRELWVHPQQTERDKIYIEWFKESRIFTIFAWLLSVFVIFHILLGTLIMSGTYFVGPRDALGIMVRYVLSVVTCRIIVVYELAIVRKGYRNGMADGGLEMIVSSH